MVADINTAIVQPENLVYQRTHLLTDAALSYCPGCGHGTAHRIIMEVIEEMGIQQDVIGISPVGCSVLAYDFMEVDMLQAAHGRAAACATAIKRLLPEKYVFTYQGDGDLAAIGLGETLHTCARGENIIIFFINNAIYGMTGGQMAPTTLLNMKTSTSPYGRDILYAGAPLKVTDMIAQMQSVYFVTRQAVHTPNYVRRTKKAVQKAFQYQKENKGLCFIEIVSNCNSGWKMTPVQSNQWLEENMLAEYPLGDLKVPK